MIWYTPQNLLQKFRHALSARNHSPYISQEEQCNEVLSRIEGYLDIIRQIVWTGCEASLQSASIGNTSTGASDSFNTSYYLRYTEQAAKRTECRRLTSCIFYSLPLMHSLILLSYQISGLYYCKYSPKYFCRQRYGFAHIFYAWFAPSSAQYNTFPRSYSSEISSSRSWPWGSNTS